MPTEEEHGSPLTPGAQRLVSLAAEKQAVAGHALTGAHHWLLALLERHAPMAEALAKGVQANALRLHLEDQLRQGNAGAPLDRDTAVERAVAHAGARGRDRANERDLAAVVLSAAGYELIPDDPAALGPHRIPATAAPDAAEAPAAFSPRATRPTPTLDQFGRDLTRQAREGRLPPVVGRDEEIRLVIETLNRRAKRNPVLVGPAGVGKTAIVEGLAQRIVSGDVPESLRGARVLEIQPGSLVAGASMAGELQARVKGILAEAGQEGIVLFIDEVHTLIGAGGSPGTSDVASQVKPALARGDLACIAATTDGEYRRFVEQDAALERRFQPIRVQEMSPEATLQVLATLRDEWARTRGVSVADEVLRWLVDFARQYLRNRHFPDKAVDLLDQAVGHAVTQGRDRVDLPDAEGVAQRMIGMPLALDDRLGALQTRLDELALLDEPDAQAIVHRLTVTLRGLDIRPLRPNAIFLLLGEAADRSDALARTIAETLFGAADRVVSIDFSPLVEAWSITRLVGSAPGYVGYADSVPLHRVAQMPWCVLACENVDACHPAVREVLAQGLAQGFITDGRGRHIYLSDTVVLLTARFTAPARPRTMPLGFIPKTSAPAEAPDPGEAAVRALDAELAAQVDAVFSRLPAAGGGLRRWLEDGLLADLSARYRQQGVALAWDETFIGWALAQQAGDASLRDWERFMDTHLAPSLIPHLPSAGGKEVKRLIVQHVQGAVRVIDSSNPERS